MKKIILLSVLVALVGCKGNNIDGVNRQINVINDVYTMYDENHEMVKMVSLKYESKCSPTRYRISSISLGVDKIKFEQVWQKIVDDFRNEFNYVLEYQCGDNASYITSVTKCTEKLCGKEYENDIPKVWFSNPTSRGEEIELPSPILHSFLTSQKSTARYYAVKPFEYLPERNVWKIVVYYANPKRIYGAKAMESFIDKESLDDAKVLETIIYNPDGSIAAKYDNYNNEGYPE